MRDSVRVSGLAMVLSMLMVLSGLVAVTATGSESSPLAAASVVATQGISDHPFQASQVARAATLPEKPQVNAAVVGLNFHGLDASEARSSPVLVEPVASDGMALNAINDGIAIAPGEHSSAQPFDTVPTEPSTWSSGWSTYDSSTTPSARTGVVLASDSRTGMVLLFGGQNGSGLLADTWSYDSRSNQWTNIPTATGPDARSFGAMSFDTISETFVLFGGQNATTIVNDTWVFDLQKSVWTRQATIGTPPGAWGHTLAYDPIASVHVLYAGQTLGGVSNSTWVYDLSQNTWMDVSKPVNPGMLFAPRAAYSSSVKKVVLFGGGDNSNPPFNATWAFDAASSSWSRLDFVSGPPGLYGPQVAADPSTGRLLVFGGYNSSVGGHLNQTWKFDPVNRTWMQIQSPYSPATRSYGGMAFDASTGKFVQFGGHDFGVGNHGDTWLFDAASMFWRQAPGPAPPEVEHGTSLVYSPVSDRIYRLFAGPTQNDTLVIDPAGGTVESVRASPIPSGRKYHSAASIDESGQILVFGAFPVGDNQTWIYDVESNLWSASMLPGSPAPRYAQAMAYDPLNRKVVMFGGLDGSNTVPYRETWLFDPANGTWSNATPAIQPRGPIWTAMTYDSVNRRILLFGGMPAIGQPSYGELWAYDVSENRWTNLTDSRTPAGREGFGMAFDAASGHALLYGGGPTTPCGASDYGDTLAYDVRTGVWSFVTPQSSPSPRCLSSIVSDPVSGRVFMVGGLDPTSTELWVYDPIGNEWSPLRPQATPPADFNFAHGFDPGSRRFVVFSGYSGTDDTWELDVSTNVWKMTNPPVRPAARGGTRMAYDSWHERLVMFSGSNGAADTWTYDTEQDVWTLMNTASGPAAQSQHGIAFDESAGVTVMFGTGGAGPETWTYDLGANSWTKMNPKASPSARSFVPLVYIPSIERTMLFGGSTFTNDTWLYDSVADNWTQVAMTGPLPPGRGAQNLVYDASTGKVILWGGSSVAAVDAADTWAFDPDTLSWTEISPRNAPLGRQGAGMGYDPESKRVVMFGGYSVSFNRRLNDTWYFDLAIAPRVVSTSPADASTGVAQEAPVTVMFDMEMDAPTTSSSFSISPAVAGKISVTGRQVTFNHGTRFARGTTYTVTIAATASNLGGDTMMADREFRFTTLAPPSVVFTDPLDNATGIALDYLPVLQFNEPMNMTSTTSASSIVPALQGAFLFTSEETMVLGHLEPFAPMTRYTITVTTAAASTTGDNLVADHTLTFTTGGADPPRLVSASPPDGATQVNASAAVTMVFSQPMDTNATIPAITSSPAATWNAVWSGGDRIVVLLPGQALVQGTKYTVTVGTAAQSKLGANMTAPVSWSFTISAWTPPPPPPPLPVPRVVSHAPPQGETNVNASAKVVISFSEPMDKDATQAAITSDGGVAHTFAWNAMADTVTLTPTAARKAGTIYAMKVSTAAKSAAGVNMTEEFSFSFTTTVYTSPPVVQQPAAPGPDFTMMILGLIIGLILGIVLVKFVLGRGKSAAEKADVGTVRSGIASNAARGETSEDGKHQVENVTVEGTEDAKADPAQAVSPKGLDVDSQRGKGVVKGVGGGSNPSVAAPPPPPPPPPGKDGKPLPYIPPPK